MFILDCNETVQMCYNARKILVIVKTLIKVIQWSVPLVLVIMGTFDMFKAVTKADDQKVTQDAVKSFTRRLISGVIIFLIPFLVRLVLNFVDKNIITGDDTSSSSWVTCWNNVDKKGSTYFNNCKNIYTRDTDSESSKSNTSESSSNSNTENGSERCACIEKGVKTYNVKKEDCKGQVICESTK